ncbi:hypothetical protein PV327_009638 [Microctonus hyperodae]|uniref:Angiogenic factor with G patch and FHA domains 1 n=1 Tax=Microctonus hyperodae TaxID=165561 RepID=A0AA39CAV5_MICHY|nr:hypothetical protein PV327_009638 [Microctonus hyperodae]
MSRQSDEDSSDCEDTNFNLIVNNKDKDYSDIQENYPELFEFISKLRDRIKCQSKKISKLRNKLINQRRLQQINNITKLSTDNTTQTDVPTSNQWNTNVDDKSSSISEQVKQAAECALQQTGFVYEETSGLYYDYNTGYYYDASQGLYYDGNSGTYYRYDDETRSYKFHSQTQLPSADETTNDGKKMKKDKKRHGKITDKGDGKKSKLELLLGEKISTDAPEEGECSDSESSSSRQQISSDSASSCDEDDGTKDTQDMAKTYPPCMRIIVKETNLAQLKIGSLFFIAYTGGSIGREGDHAVLIPDINISKHHARFQYEEQKKQYEIVDLGSRNGTILNGKRLSVAKQESEPYQITHGSIVQVGNTKLLCHIHSGYETCGHCEPGLIQQNSNNDENVLSIKKQHHSELKRLKNKFGLEKNCNKIARGYRDRAQARRECVGSSNHYAKTQQSCIETSIAKDNKGFELLSRMGWSEGQSLGKDGDGRTEPVTLMNNSSKTGLGAFNSNFIEVNSTIERKHALLRKTRQRYDEITE